MWPNPQFPVVLVTFTKEILHGKLYFSCVVRNVRMLYQIEQSLIKGPKAFFDKTLNFQRTLFLSFPSALEFGLKGLEVEVCGWL